MAKRKAAQQVTQKLSKLDPTDLPTGKFVSANSDGTVNIDFGQGSTVCQSASTFQPLPGDLVRCIHVGSSTVMIGPSIPRSAIGKVTSTGTPTITVTTSIGSKQLPYYTGYTPTVNDTVLIDWASGGVVIGKVTTAPATTYAPAAPLPTDFSVDFGANDSGSYGAGTWNQADVWCSDSYLGAWFYGSTIADTIPDAAVINSVQIYIDEFFNEFPSSLATIGMHSLTSKSGAPAIDSTVTIPPGSGWMSLPTSFGDALKTGARWGVGTGHGGYHKFRSRSADADSGKLRIAWTV